MRPVRTIFLEMSGNSKLAPIRVERAFKWNSGSLVGPVLKTWGVVRKTPTNGKSSPLGELESRTPVALMKPYGVILTPPMVKAAFRPSLTGGSTGSTRKGAMAGTTAGLGGVGGLAGVIGLAA